jgi:exosortase
VTIYLFGFRFTKEISFPLCFLLFMIPVPSQIFSALTIPLQLIVSKISVGIASTAGIPILREGNVIFLPGHTLEVVQACSGLRSMMSLLMLSAVYGYFLLSSVLARSILIGLSVPTAILVNIFRVTATVFAYHFMDFDLAAGTAHTVFGVIIFVLALILIALFQKALTMWDQT